MILLFVGAVGAVACMFAGVAAWRAPAQSSPGIFISTLGAVWLTTDFFRITGMVLAFQAMSNVSADQKQDILAAGVSAAMEPLLPASIAMLAILAVHLWGISRVRKAGRSVFTGPAIALNVVAALPILLSLALQAKWISGVTGSAVNVSGTVSTMYTSTAVAMLGVPTEGFLSVAALVVGFGLARREARFREETPTDATP